MTEEDFDKKERKIIKTEPDICKAIVEVLLTRKMQ